MITLKKNLLIVYVFFFVFNPYNFTEVNPIHILFLIAMVFFTLKLILSFSSIKIDTILTSLLLFSVCILLYFLAVYFVSGEHSALIKSYGLFVYNIEIFVCAIFINSVLLRLNSGLNDIYRLIFVVILIQLFFVYLSLLVPSFRDWFIDTSSIEGLDNISNQFGLLRSYGLGSGITYSLPILFGLVSVCLLSEFFKRKSILCLVMFISSVLTVVINAQTGILPILFYFSLRFLAGLLIYKNYHNFIALLLLSIVVIIGLVWFLPEDISIFRRTAMRFVDIINLFSGEVTGVFLELKAMHFLPPTELMSIFGYGRDPFSSGLPSDVGYIRDIHQVGFIGSFLVYIFTSVILFISFISLKEKFGVIAALAVVMSIPFFYFKGMMFSSNDVMNTLLLISVNKIYKWRG